MIRYFTIFCVSLLSALPICLGQVPTKKNSAEIYEAIKKLNVLCSVLYVAAHPDDENTNLLSYLSNEKKFEARYLSLTRGDGGQNLIGPEQAELLGMIRTQELLKARSIDGGKQAFTRANDFGYSKTPSETLKKWDKQKVLADVVWAIRKYKPDIIINRFSTSTERPNHGHHTASAIIGLEAYDLAADPNAFPEQLNYVSVWKPKRYLANISWWFYGGKDKFEAIDKSNWQKLDIGVYYPLKGKSNTEIAAESRSQHRCQGMGTISDRGDYTEWFEFMKGDRPATDLLDGINTSWSRIENGTQIGILIAQIVNEYNFDLPENSVPKLLEVWSAIQSLPDSHWKTIKTEELKLILRSCLGLYLEASATDFSAVPGEKVSLNIEMINRSKVALKCSAISIAAAGKDSSLNLVMQHNKNYKFKMNMVLPMEIPYSNAYWLNQPHSANMYEVADQQMIGLPETPRLLKAKFLMEMGKEAIEFDLDIAHKFEDPIKGEIFRPLEIVPPVSIALDNKAYIFGSNASKEIRVTIKAGQQESVNGFLSLKMPTGWNCKPAMQSFTTQKKGEEQIFTFELFPPKVAGQGEILAYAKINGREYSKRMTSIQYDHIPTQMVYQESSSKVSRVDLKSENRKIAYVMGAGDEIPQSLKQIGFDVTVLEDKDITTSNLKKFDVVIMGIRAYNAVERLKVLQPRLYEFVENGGTMIVQYNNNFDMFLEELAPFKMKLSRDRVTDEDAEMRFLNKDHIVLKSPNLISSADFDSWVQERGLYFPSEWDPKMEALLACNDQGEPSKNGSLLIAPFGKGYYIYTGLSFFRQLPAGVPGAYRLFTNLICLKQKNQTKK